MAEKGKITEDRLVDSSIYEIGQKIAKSLKEGNVAVNDINKDLLAFANNLESIKKFGIEFSKLDKAYKNTNSQREFLKLRQEEASLTEQNKVAYKEQARLETNLIKTIERKTLATESTNKSLIKNRFELQQLNKVEKENAILTSKSSTEMQKATARRSKAIRTIQDLNVKKELGNKLSNKEQRELRQSERAFLKYDKAIKIAKKSTGQFQENVGNYPKLLGGAIQGFKTLIPLIGAGFGLREAWNFTQESLQLAREAKGVEFAFKNIGIEGVFAFDRVKKATKGLLSDLEIKKSIVEFDNFNLSASELDTVLEFVAVRATQTGKSFDYLRDSAIEAISKESVRRADNLGLSQKELNDKIKEGGTFLEAFNEIAQREIKEAGNILTEAGSAQQRFNAELENFKVSAGSGFIKKFTDDVYDLGAAFISLFKDINDNSEGYWDFITNMFNATQIGGVVQLQTDAAIKKEMKSRIPIVEEILKLQEKQGVLELQRIKNKDKLLKTNSLELKQMLKKIDLEVNGKKEKKTELTDEELAALKKRREELANDEFKLNQFRIQEAIKTKEEIIKNEDFLGLQRIRAIQEKEALEIQLAEEKEAHLLSNQKLTADARTLIEEQTASKIQDIYTQTFKDIDKIKEELLKKSLENPLEEIDIPSDAENDIKILQDGIRAYAESLGIDGEGAVKQFAEEHGNQFEKIKEFYDKVNKTAKKSAALRKELERDLANSAIEFVNTLFDAKIVGIENEINANNEKYESLYNMAVGDKDQQQRIRQEQEENNRKLEKKRREEERKAAIFNKLLAVTEIGINLAKTITAINLAAAAIDTVTLGTGGLAYRAANLPFAIASSALQVGTVLAQKIPQYATGIESTPRSEIALVGEERPEVITEPNKDPYIVSKPTYLDLPKGTRVTPSIEEYQRLMRASNMASLSINHKKATSYQQSKEAFNSMDLKELIQETKKNTETLKRKNLSVTNNIKGTDFNHELFRIKNTNWEA